MRTWLAGVLAIVVTLALFYLMRHLIAADPVAPETPPPTPVTELVPPPETPPPNEEPPEPPPMEKPPIGGGDEVVATVQPPTEPPVQPIRPPGPGAYKTTLTEPGVGERGPVPRFAPPPRYPQDELMRGTQGWVRVAFTIRADGSVADARVVEAAPRRGVFDDAALTALRGWRFEPKTDATGTPVPSRAEYTIEFRIDDGA